MVSIFEKYLGIAVAVFVYVTSASLTIALLVFLRDPIIVPTTDKTLVESTGVQQVYEDKEYGRDILLMLLNTDSMTPYPKAIRINNTPVIHFNNQFFSSRMQYVSDVYNASGQYKLSTMLDYKIISTQLVYSGPDAPYIQYTLGVGP